MGRLARLMTRLLRVGSTTPLQLPVDDDGGREWLEGLQCDAYSPRSALRSTWIPVHGVTINGGRDYRLVNFARGLASVGASSIVPSLPGLASGRFELSDVSLLERLIMKVSEERGHQVGLIGFSYGGSYSLLAAARPAVADRVHTVIGFGPYYRLDELFEWYKIQNQREPRTDMEWDDVIYQRLIMAHARFEDTALAEELRPQIHSMLQRYCDHASLEEKRQFFEDHLRQLDIVELGSKGLNAQRLTELSPAGILGGIRAAVGLVHDANDVLVPPDHSERILAELHKLGSGQKHKLVVTTMLAHVTPANVWRVDEGIRLLSSLAPLVAEYTRPLPGAARDFA